MKFGIRRRSYKKSFKAMTTGRMKRSVKRAVLPMYGKKGAGWIKNPKKAAYNVVYKKTTVKSPLPYFSSPLSGGSGGPRPAQPHKAPIVESFGGMPETIATASRALSVGSQNFEQLKHDLAAVYENRAKLRKELAMAQVGHYAKFMFSSKEKRQATKAAIQELKDAIDHAYIDLIFRKEMKDPGSWEECSHYFQQLMQSDMVWDLTTRQDTDKYRQRTVADESIQRKPIANRAHQTLEFIRADVDNLYLPNVNGADLYIYPTFVVLFKNYKQFSIHDLQVMDIIVKLINFHEDERVPADATVVGETYKYTNKNGTPDKRFQNNFVIPITKYGNLSLKSDSGIYDRYMFSSAEKFSNFGKSFVKYADANLKMNMNQE